MDGSQPLDPRKTIFVGGVPRPLRAGNSMMPIKYSTARTLNFITLTRGWGLKWTFSLWESNSHLGFPGGWLSGYHVKNSWCNGRFSLPVTGINIAALSAIWLQLITPSGLKLLFHWLEEKGRCFNPFHWFSNGEKWQLLTGWPADPIYLHFISFFCCCSLQWSWLWSWTGCTEVFATLALTPTRSSNIQREPDAWPSPINRATSLQSVPALFSCSTMTLTKGWVGSWASFTLSSSERTRPKLGFSVNPAASCRAQFCSSPFSCIRAFIIAGFSANCSVQPTITEGHASVCNHYGLWLPESQQMFQVAST